jgi:hypothetical protein
MPRKRTTPGKSVEALTHNQEKRTYIPTAEYQALMRPEEQAPRRLRHPRNTDLDPQLVWRGKDEQIGATSSSPPRRSTSRRDPPQGDH